MGVMVQHRKYNSPVNVPNKPSSSDRVGEWEGGVPGHARTVTPVTTAAAPGPDQDDAGVPQDAAESVPRHLHLAETINC